VCSFFLFSLSFLLSLLISSHHAREERDSEKFFFFHPRFLDGDLMELKSFRDAHRCALYSHAAWGTRRKNSLRAKKKSPDRWSTIWEINYRARRNLAEIISHGSAVVIAVVALKSLLRALAARRVSAYRYANLISHQDSAPCPRYNYRWWFFFFYIVLSFYSKKKKTNCFRQLSFLELIRLNYHIWRIILLTNLKL